MADWNRKVVETGIFAEMQNVGEVQVWRYKMF